MRVEVDQSGRIEQLDTDTVIAYANGKASAVFVTAGTKRKIIQFLKRKTLVSSRTLPSLVFSTCLFMLVSELNEPITLVIDEEYSGKEKVIKKTLDRLAFKFPKKYLKITVRFDRIGKLSPAHRLAWKVHRSKNRQRYRKLKEEEILVLFH